MNRTRHQQLINEQGSVTAVLVPQEDYQFLMLLAERYAHLQEFERGLRGSLTDVERFKRGELDLPKIETLFDAL